MKRDEEKLNEWRAFLEERKERKLTVKEFCQEKNITPAQFYYYQGIINNPEKSQPPKAQKSRFSNIKPIQIVKTADKENTTIRFILPNSLQCILPRDMSHQEIKAILELVMSC